MKHHSAGDPQGPQLEIVSVEKSYDGKAKVVSDLNISISDGEFLTLLGPSGSGKSTTLMMLAGFETPSSGEILMYGRSLLNVAPHQRNMGVVFQDYALFPHMSVAENIAFPLVRRRLPRHEIKASVQAALEMIELSSMSERLPAQLSGGQQQRVALARALVFEPSVILMDEPLGALDKRLRETMQIEIKRLHHRLGTTFIYVTHDQSEALTMSDRIGVFESGRLQQIGSPDEIYQRPENTFIANFIGENNNLVGVVGRVDGDKCAVNLAGGARVIAIKHGVIAVGDSVTVTIRPEYVGVAGNSGQQLTTNIDEIVYCGDHCRLYLGNAERLSLTAKVNLEVAQALSIGQKVQAQLPEERCVAFLH